MSSVLFFGTWATMGMSWVQRLLQNSVFHHSKGFGVGREPKLGLCPLELNPEPLRSQKTTRISEQMQPRPVGIPACIEMQMHILLLLPY